jgi:hypothetical protein
MSATQALTSVALQKDPRGRRQLGRDHVLAAVRDGATRPTPGLDGRVSSAGESGRG